jgi:DNA-binding NtrC family response regulator
MKPRSVIIVETDLDIRTALMSAFEERGYLTWTCPATDLAVQLFSTVLPDIVVLDLDLADGDAMDLLHTWKRVSPETRVVVESGAEDIDRKRLAEHCGAEAYFVKPYLFEPLFSLLEDRNTTPHTPHPPHTRAA